MNKNSNNNDIAALEKWLWKAACVIRGEVDAAKYKDYILPLIFLKRLSDVFDDELARAEELYGSREEAERVIEQDHDVVRFYLPPETRWRAIAAKRAGIGEYFSEVVHTIARENPPLEGVINVADFNASISGQRIISDDTLDILVGMGQGCVGYCTFDSVIVRDLTTKRYEYIYGKGRKLAKVEYEGDLCEAQVYYYHNDLLGSPVALSNMDGETVWKGDYMPFGEEITDQVHWGNNFTYLGNEDGGGLMYFNARYYAKELGRFMSCDPIKSVSSTLVINP